jgi:nitrogen-specific signal transduction histidine kinase
VGKTRDHHPQISYPITKEPLVVEMDNKLFVSFLNKSDSPPEFISGREGVFTPDRNTPSGLLQNGEPDLNRSGKREKDFIESEKKANPLDSFPKKDEVKPKESKEEGLPAEQGPAFMESFLIELVHSIKKALASICHDTALAMDKYDDVEIRKSSHIQVKEEIKKIDSVLNNLLNFINVNTPIAKPNTLHVILEEILEADEKQFRQKDIKIHKKYEKDLPDTYIQPEQVRFILHAVLQYAILSTPPSETIGFLMKSSDNGTGADKTFPEDKRRYVEVIIGFNGGGKPVDPSENSSETPGDQSIGLADLTLKLAKDILERNRGMMIETHREKSKTLIALRFPIEKRKVVHYRPIAL